MATPRQLAPLLRGETKTWPDGAPWHSVLEEHDIGPLLYAKAPRDAPPAVRDVALRAAAIEPFRLTDLRRVLDALASNGIDVLIVKGTALAYSLYASPDLRPRGDTDLLLDVAQRDAARDVFKSLGFVEKITSGDELAFRQTSFVRRDANGLEHLYDVHWAIANTPVFADVLRFDELRARAVALPAIGPHARTISDVDALLYACVHRVAHHYDSDRLIWLADIALLRDRIADHAPFARLAAERGVVGVCIRSLDLAAEWFGGRDAAACGLVDSAEAQNEPTRKFLRHRRGAAHLASDLAALGNWRARARRLRQLAFPPPAFLHARFGTRSRAALPWLYAVRAMRGVARLFRRVS